MTANFGMSQKLGPRYIAPFQIISRVGKVTYRLYLPEELSQIDSTFYVSQLRKCVLGEDVVMSLDDIQVDEWLNYVKRHVATLERKMKFLKSKDVTSQDHVQLINPCFIVIHKFGPSFQKRWQLSTRGIRICTLSVLMCMIWTQKPPSTLSVPEGTLSMLGSK